MNQTVLLPPDDLYPVEITSCQDEPSVPARPAPDQPRPPEAVAGYITDLRGAWADCHDDVKATALRKDLYQERFKDLSKPKVFRKNGLLSWVPFT